MCANAQTAQVPPRMLTKSGEPLGKPSDAIVAITRKSGMNTQYKVFPLQHLIVMTADGTLDLAASKLALKSIVADPGFDSRSEILLDLRDAKCVMSMTDIYQLAEHMAFPYSALPTRKKIAVLINKHSAGHLAFNHAQFLELCADNRGLNVHAFEDYQIADEWLNAELPNDPKRLRVAASMPGE